MKCFIHPHDDAVGSCKHCFKGVCAACAKDTGLGLVCSPACEVEVRSVQGMLERNRKLIAFAPQTHSRNALWLGMLALLFIAFGVVSEGRFLSAYLIGFGILMLGGAGLSFLNGRRITRMSSPDKS